MPPHGGQVFNIRMLLCGEGGDSGHRPKVAGEKSDAPAQMPAGGGDRLQARERGLRRHKPTSIQPREG